MYEEKLHTMALVCVCGGGGCPTQEHPRLLSVLFCLGAETEKDLAFATPKRKGSQDGATLLPS